MARTKTLPVPPCDVPGRGSGFERLAQTATEWTGSSVAFALAGAVILVWLCSGPLFGFSDTWQLVINTGTTIVTFLMVFLIQRAHNKDAQAVHLKLNELIASMGGASNRLVNAENLPEEELRRLHAQFTRLLDLAKRDRRLSESHSVEEASPPDPGR
jgi:low affinity Fe/Cu permease